VEGKGESVSEQEQDVAMGRLVREYVGAKRQSAIMAGELETVEREIRSLADVLHDIQADGSFTAARRVLEGEMLVKYGFAKLLAFLEEYGDVRKSVAHMGQQLREIGVDLR
jgi:hypothetical protein